MSAIVRFFTRLVASFLLYSNRRPALLINSAVNKESDHLSAKSLAYFSAMQRFKVRKTVINEIITGDGEIYSDYEGTIETAA